MANTARSQRRMPRRRTAAVAAGALVVLTAFGIRLVDIQVVQASDLVAESRESTGGSRALFGERGDIVDANGVVLATSTTTYDVVIDPCNVANMDIPGNVVCGARAEDYPNWDRDSEMIAEITGQKPETIRQIVADAQDANAATRYAMLTSGVDTEQMMRLKELQSSEQTPMPYLGFISHESRQYPNGAVAGNVIGFVAADAESNGVKAQAGVEAMADTCLAATDGSESFIRGNHGEMIPGSLQTTPAVDGGTVQLTIDTDLNWYLQQLITEEAKREQAQSGTITVVEVATGKIRAAAEYPTIDSNDPGASDAANRRSRIFEYTFEPGSTFKPATAAMLLDSGKATPTSTELVPWTFTPPGTTGISDSFSHEEWNYTLAGALVDSSNVGLSKFGTRLDPDTRHDYLQRFGVGSRTAVNFYNESSGMLHPTSEWDPQSVYATTFGQHFTVTSAQVVSLYQAFANDGVREPLQLIESCTDADGTVHELDHGKSERLLEADDAKDLQHMIENVGETGPVSDMIKIPGYRVAAKTGTAQLYDAEHGGYLQGVYFTSIVGFAPADDPKYVVMVTLDRPLKNRTSSATAPAMKKAMTQVMKTYHVKPSTEPFVEDLPKFGD